MKKQPKKPKFNQYWIIGSIIFIFILLNAPSLIGNGSQASSNINETEFFDLAETGQVEKVVIVNRQIANVFLTNDAKLSGEHKNSNRSPISSFFGNSPDYQFEISTVDRFYGKIDQINDDKNIKIDIDNKTEHNLWGEIFSIYASIYNNYCYLDFYYA